MMSIASKCADSSAARMRTIGYATSSARNNAGRNASWSNHVMIRTMTASALADTAVVKTRTIHYAIHLKSVYAGQNALLKRSATTMMTSVSRNVDQSVVRVPIRAHPPPTSPSSAILKARSAADKCAMKGKNAVATTRIAEQSAENNAATRTMISRKSETLIIHPRRHRLRPGRRPCVMALLASNGPALRSCVFPSLAMLAKCTRMARSIPTHPRAKLCSGFFLRMSGFCALLTTLLNNGIF
mmetsp:Transcript_23181/g.50399  ORF Transcript_23181/g.50399 Transcript_23181/m.50399 type:complete len:242 (+) Transcript_23181:1552-2277(+)